MPSLRTLGNEICWSDGAFFISEPRVRRLIEAVDDATAVMSRLEALDMRTQVSNRGSRGKEATEFKPQTWSGEKGSESFTALKIW